MPVGMTTLQLLFLIVFVLLLQLICGIGVSVWRWRNSLSADAPSTPANASSPAWPYWRNFRITRRAFEDDARTQCSFYFEPVDGAPLPPFKPGQFLTFSAPGGPSPLIGDGGLSGPITRCYSLSSRPDPANYRVTIKRAAAPAAFPNAPPGICSSYFHDRVQVGDIIKVKAPAGQFFLDADPSRATVLVAGGIGITPMLSMLLWAFAEQPDRTLHLFYGVQNGAVYAFRTTLEELAQSHPNFRLHVLYDTPSPSDGEGLHVSVGRVDIDLLKRTLPDGVAHTFYVCGPPAMMESIVPALRAWGIPTSDIRTEAFGPASLRPSVSAPEAGPFDVRFRRAGRSIIWNGQDASLLDFAERNGVEVDSGCRSGSCGTCEANIVSGSVRETQKPDYEVRDGHCLLCVSVPTSALVLEA
ncbi:MAG: oxidoreductase FAD/NAD(P)-binding subunit [Caulobacteraceae bacterium]|nr:MAG: oxidoreductase FAD/NAD(P)-binding subunit [Caulobacteraceae bacterium]